jgi:hypothetical protein
MFCFEYEKNIHKYLGEHYFVFDAILKALWCIIVYEIDKDNY